MPEPAIFGLDLFGDPIAQASRGKIADDFGCPPFSVLSSREGWWQERKAAWIGHGIDGEISREDRLKLSEQCRRYKGGYETADGSVKAASGTSIFDPVLCEMVYRWFSPPGGMVVDPFAGGSVRGIVAAMLGRKYHGIDLRPEQIEVNREQAQRICPGELPVWVAGDSRTCLADSPAADLIFSCPPYFDLERYSEDPADLSAMIWPNFLDAYRAIIAAAVARLKTDRFAVFVVGDVRDNGGLYRNLPGVTIDAFHHAGMALYNAAVLVTPAGSLPIRIGSQFNKSRKLGTTHQNIYVFVKGCPKRATALIPLN